MDGLTTSQAAKASGVKIETIRYYEKRGLISEPPRTESGYRKFANEVVEDIRFIKRAQDLGFKLDEIKQLLSFEKGQSTLPVEEMLQFATVKIHEVEQKIEQLMRFKALLGQVADHPESVQPLHKDQCPVLKTITGGRNE